MPEVVAVDDKPTDPITEVVEASAKEKPLTTLQKVQQGLMNESDVPLSDSYWTEKQGR